MILTATSSNSGNLHSTNLQLVILTLTSFNSGYLHSTNLQLVILTVSSSNSGNLPSANPQLVILTATNSQLRWSWSFQITTKSSLTAGNPQLNCELIAVKVNRKHNSVIAAYVYGPANNCKISLSPYGMFDIISLLYLVKGHPKGCHVDRGSCQPAWHRLIFKYSF